MRGLFLPLMLAFVLAASTRAQAHCEIPCGIYGDDLRFSTLQEDITTIEKSMKKIVELSVDPTANANQITRWVLNKETHADHIREVVTQYFMTQRIKLPDVSDAAAVASYQERLGLLHKMLVYAMKSKQTTDTQWTQKLHDTVHAFEEAYTR
ncbi:MAG: superoxide dismutase [Gemmatimonadetes bacterium]|jgi:nickel superoxide dismutase|nr:superoxide dismutase [Gemmatimonadota bacterium]MBT7859123.1 superoxide dismutase [Gemmatimonadota bacterium]